MRYRVAEDAAFNILRVKGKQARIGVNAPKLSAVHREEVLVGIEEAEKDRHVKKRLVFKSASPASLTAGVRSPICYWNFVS